jgi:hypothetical protein
MLFACLSDFVTRGYRSSQLVILTPTFLFFSRQEVEGDDNMQWVQGAMGREPDGHKVEQVAFTLRASSLLLFSLLASSIA